jgi:hypothetical protein
VYGPAAVFGPRKQRNLDEEMERYRSSARPGKSLLHSDGDTGMTTDVLSNAWFGQNIPLEQQGLCRRSERVRSRRWEVYITIGEKQ